MIATPLPMDLTRPQILALRTAHLDTWELSAAPDWMRRSAPLLD
jgi:hypothetical protein